MTGRTTPRDLAVEALQDRSGNVSAHLDRLLETANLSHADRALARELALGTVRRRGTLKAILRAYLTQPDRRLPTPLTEIFHVALYQILFLDRVPDFAAVNEAVDQAGRLIQKKQTGFVNGVLRTVLRELSPEQTGDISPAADAVPLGGGRFRQVKRVVFADPTAEPARWLAAAYSLSPALARRWVDHLGSLTKAITVADHASCRAPLIVRVNAMRATPAEAREKLAADGVEAVSHENGVSLVLEGHVDLASLAAFREGLIQPQDPTATAVGLAVGVKPGMNVLDFCAAPGTKTTHMTELMNDTGTIIAMDVSDAKIQRITENTRRLGVGIVQTMLADKAGSLTPQSFDVVLADVPCSNTGVLARRAEARWRFDAQQFGSLVKDQMFLATAAAMFVRPGGRLVYSTCSIEPEENSRLIQRLAQKLPKVTLRREQLTLPAGQTCSTQWHDGGYYAILEVR